MKALIVLAGLGVLAMMSEVFRFKKFLLPIVALGLIAVLGLNISDWNNPTRYFHDMAYFDNYAIAFISLITVLTLLWLLISKEYFASESSKAEHATLILFCLTGAAVMVSYADLSMFFIGLEILSISLYVLASSHKLDLRSNEAGLKYLLMGAFATGFLLFGMALIYGATATFNLVKIAAFVNENQHQLPAYLYAGVVLMMVGLLFKVSAAPFHFWAPDVYEGAPTLVTAYMATIVKTAAFAAFYRLFSTCFADMSLWWGPALAVIAAITMLLGNITAVYQVSFKRMLAFSSIAHAGYLLMAIVAMNSISSGAILMYATAYSVASLGAFACLDAISNNGEDNEKITALRGLASRQPVLAFFFSILVLSLAGIPPVAGFFAKYYIFYGAMQSNYIWLLVIAVISSLIGVYYYFRLIFTMFQPSEGEQHTIISSSHGALLILAALISLCIGIYPNLILGLL
jgi:NADH-quinone oxidoreductase subunit N